MDNLTYNRMERLRGQLVAAAMKKETFLHSDVLILSQSLDKLIVKVQTEKYKVGTSKYPVSHASAMN